MYNRGNLGCERVHVGVHECTWVFLSVLGYINTNTNVRSIYVVFTLILFPGFYIATKTSSVILV